MRQKLITALSLFFVVSLLFSAQLIHTPQAYAVEKNVNQPTPTQPVTNPVTGPITGPITGPVSDLFTICGNVTNHIFGLFKRGAERIMPAAGVKVKAFDIFNPKKVFTTTTDANGNYSLPTGKAGLYQVEVSGGEASFYNPPLRFVPLKKAQEVKHVDFKGTVFKF